MSAAVPTKIVRISCFCGYSATAVTNDAAHATLKAHVLFAHPETMALPAEELLARIETRARVMATLLAETA